jgi:hypothetical protein
MENENNSAALALGSIIEVLSRLDDESRARVLKTVLSFFNITPDDDYPDARTRLEASIRTH